MKLSFSLRRMLLAIAAVAGMLAFFRWSFREADLFRWSIGCATASAVGLIVLTANRDNGRRIFVAGAMAAVGALTALVVVVVRSPMSALRHDTSTIRVVLIGAILGWLFGCIDMRFGSWTSRR